VIQTTEATQPTSASPPASPGIIARLLNLEDAREFHDRHWPDRLFVAHGPPERLAGLVDLPELREVTSLLRMKYRDFRADGAVGDGYEASSLPTVEDAPRHYDQGQTLYFANLQAPSFPVWLRGVERELSLPPFTVQVDAFASRRGPGLIPHFDAQDNFIVQVRGSKRWQIAENHHVRYPTRNAVVGQFSRERYRGDLETRVLMRQARNGLPDTFPSESVTVDLQPGSVIFLPRGYWHVTETTSDESLHFTVSVRTLTKADVFRLLFTLLSFVDSEQWRAPALNLWRDGQPSGPGLAGVLADLPLATEALMKLLAGAGPEDLRLYMEVIMRSNPLPGMAQAT
jgi:hypothetical protein